MSEFRYTLLGLKKCVFFSVTKEVKSCMDEPDRETVNWNSVGVLPTKTPPNNNRQGQREQKPEPISPKNPTLSQKH